jgi:hypothetical protein
MAEEAKTKKKTPRAPSKTVTTGGVAGAITIALTWVAQTIWPGLDIPAEVQGAFTVIVTFLAAWIVRDPERRATAKH